MTVDQDLRCSFDVLRPLTKQKFLKEIKSAEKKENFNKMKLSEENLKPLPS